MISDPVSQPNPPMSDPAETSFKIASVWLAKGQIERAIAGFEKVLQLNPDHLQAAIHLDHLRQQQTWNQLPSNPGKIRVALAENSENQLNLTNQKTFPSHRSGWSFAIHALKALHNNQGILFDGFLESSFLWQERQSGQKREPYTEPWVGFLHNPPSMPTWFYYQDSPQVLFTKENWLKSLESCVGLFTLSEYHARWLREKTHKPISALIYPTEIPDLQFDFERFMANPHKKIIQLGWWLRKLAAIYQLPITKNNPFGYQKIKLNTAFSLNSDTLLQELLAKQIEVERIVFDSVFVENTQEITHVLNHEYDQLLSENIGFVDLYDASANTTVIECMARATPLLINPLPAVKEYLGEDYPLYFHSLEEAAEKAMNLELIQQTHQYLKNCETRQKLSGDYFVKSLQESEVYQLIQL